MRGRTHVLNPTVSVFSFEFREEEKFTFSVHSIPNFPASNW